MFCYNVTITVINICTSQVMTLDKRQVIRREKLGGGTSLCFSTSFSLLSGNSDKKISAPFCKRASAPCHSHQVLWAGGALSSGIRLS